MDDRTRDVWGPRAPFDAGAPWPARVDERTVAPPERWVRSACVLCSTGCALEIGVREDRIVGVRGVAEDRINRGRLGPKGLHGWEANGSPDRLVRPLIRRGGKRGRLEPASWDEALDLVAGRIRDLAERHTAGAIGFYNSGQLLLEEYYTLAVIARAGIGTNHLDGNTRLCTSTASMALIESFGADGPPGSFTDFELAECVLLVGHNLAETQTVLWARLLDRRAGPRPPKLVVIDPRRTPTAAEADVHLAPRLGTNVAVLNGLLHLVIANGHVDRAWVDAHTVGFDALAATVAKYTPEHVERISGIPPRDLRRAAELVGEARSLVSSCLQGVYQSNQATAAAVQVNNLNLVRGMIGRPGCTVFQMNGQPTAQNTRECGADGEFPVFLNYANPDHVRRLAEHWNVDPARIPQYAKPTHIEQMLRYAEEGSLRFLWVLATNPAVSLPDLARVRRILRQETLFLVVSDAWPTETVALADVVLPAAIWGEKTGVATNADRTVHLLRRAVPPPGEARSDFDVLVELARRLDLRDRDGAPLVKWSTPREAFDDFARLSKGRPCDYSGLSHARLAESNGVQWPCNERHPDGRERLYTDGVFPTAAEACELYGHDLVTGAEVTAEVYRARDPRGRAFLKPAEYVPPPEEPDDRWPFWLTTGRRVHHFHTRTKTGRSPALARAAPEAILEISSVDAQRLGVVEGDRVEVATRRGAVRVRARVVDGLPGHLFLPFHYGSADSDEAAQAANELTLTYWDPVSKQPTFKFAAVRVRKL